MQRSQVFGWLLVVPLLTISAAAQQLSGSPAPLTVPMTLDSLLAAGNQSPFSGSVPAGGIQPGVIDLSVQDAIDLGLKFNLGLVLSAQNTAQARAERLKQLSNLLPQLNGDLRESQQKINLAAEGFGIRIPGVILSPGVEFSNSDLRVFMTEDLVDFHNIENTRAAGAGVRAATYTFGAARETVVLATAASYLLVISAESQVADATAELQTAEALYKLAQDRENAGLNPNIDTLRARVELQVRRQNLIQANNDLAKQRITLLRVLGLPVHQQFRLVTRVPYKPLSPITETEALQTALASRPDYMAAEKQVEAAQLRLRAAQDERLPSIGIAGDYGALGTHPDNAFATWSVAAALKIPIFQGGKIESDIRKAHADLRQAQAQRDDLKGRIEQDVADAMLDIASAAEQVEVAQDTVNYAQQALTQSQDRFSAGVTNNIEVIQAQESVANANDQYISSLYAHNLAKVLLARAMGVAEQRVRQAVSELPAVAQPAPTQPAPDASANPATAK